MQGGGLQGVIGGLHPQETPGAADCAVLTYEKISNMMLHHAIRCWHHLSHLSLQTRAAPFTISGVSPTEGSWGSQANGGTWVGGG